MKAADLGLEELVDFAEGRLGFKERRLVLHHIHGPRKPPKGLRRQPAQTVFDLVLA